LKVGDGLFKHLSYSHLHLLACPYSAFLKYQAAVKGPTTKWIALGNAVHTGIEDGHVDGSFVLDAAVTAFKDEFVRIVEDEQVSIGWPELKKMEAEGLDMLGRYHAQIQDGTLSPTPLALEEPFEIPFLGTAIVGRIDKLEKDENGYIVTDFKSGKSKPLQWDLKHNVQLSTYAWAVLEKYGEIPYKVVWHHLRTGELLEQTRTMQDINDVKNMVGNAIAINEAGIRTRIYHEKVCGQCDYQGPTCDDRELEKEALEALEIGERLDPRVVIKPQRWSL
jgi:CRISPR/Cas system-associated exonuclease Cas4 (RecB family)